MSLNAYRQAAARTESPREMEYRLFTEVTLALIAASKMDVHDVQGRVDALDWNRRLWTTLSDDCSRADNALPKPLRASIISLGLWVGKHTSLVIRGLDEELRTGINDFQFRIAAAVNREIPSGDTRTSSPPGAASQTATPPGAGGVS